MDAVEKLSSLSYPDFCAEIWAEPLPLTKEESDLMHAAWGLVGEVLEYGLSETAENDVEELGDITFYIQRLESMVKRSSAYKAYEPPVDGFWNNFARCVEALHNQLKRKFWYRLEVDLEPFVDDVVSSFYQYLMSMDYTIEEIRAANRRKLMKRYSSGKFSSKEAAERADKNE